MMYWKICGEWSIVKMLSHDLQGMRGKKHSGPDIEENSISDQEFEKRSPMGFQGMRGKKDLTPDFADSYFTDEYFKRAPMGFQGMRGKKTIVDDDYYKRATMGFQGMRGKKSLDLVSLSFCLVLILLRFELMYQWVHSQCIFYTSIRQ